MSQIETLVRILDIDFLKCLDFSSLAYLSCLNKDINMMTQSFLNVDDCIKVTVILMNMARNMGSNEVNIFTKEEIKVGLRMMGRTTCVDPKTKEIHNGLGVTYSLELRDNKIYCCKTTRYNLYGVFPETLYDFCVNTMNGEDIKSLMSFVACVLGKECQPIKPLLCDKKNKNTTREYLAKLYMFPVFKEKKGSILDRWMS